MKILLSRILLFFILLLPGVVHAQGVEEIRQYDTNIAIAKDGSIAVAERIYYVFPDERHGIFRSIPLVKTNADGKKYQMTIKDVSVTDEKGAAYPFSKTDEGEDTTLKVGDPNRTITGAHWYVISYSVAGALTYFPGHDELFWNAIGNKWEVPIRMATTTVTLPQSVPLSDLNFKCDVCTTSATENSVIFQANKELQVSEGMTVVVGFPKGMVAVLEPAELVPFFSTLIGKMTAVIIALIAFFWYIVAPVLVVRKWWVNGRDPKAAMGVTHAWFSPPRTRGLRDLTSAETGTLVDEFASLRDIYASLVDLARRGYMKIIETKKGQFDFEKQKSWVGDKELQPFEKTLLSAIFAGKDRVSLKDLNLTATFEKVKGQIYTSLVADGFFPEDPSRVRTKYYILAGFALVTGNILLTIAAGAFGTAMPKKTPLGSQGANIAKSLKNFLVSQDKKLAFQASRQMMFEKLLPYAIAFGVEEVWAKRFESLGLRQPDWYESSSGARFNSVVFAHSIGRAAAVSFASSVASKSSTGHSSGFSGGFSGGGGGGGGGGSW